MLTAALTRARRLAPQFFVTVQYRTAPIFDVVATCDTCERGYTAGQFAALRPLGVLPLADGTDHIAARECSGCGVAVVGP